MKSNNSQEEAVEIIFPHNNHWRDPEDTPRQGNSSAVTGSGNVNRKRVEFSDGYVILVNGTSIRKWKAGEATVDIVGI